MSKVMPTKPTRPKSRRVYNPGPPLNFTAGAIALVWALGFMCGAALVLSTWMWPYL